MPLSIAGECSCLPDFIPYPNERGFPVCHQQNLQGPCKDGFQLVVVSEDDDVQPEGTTQFGTACIKSNCPDGQERHQPRSRGNTFINLEIIIKIDLFICNANLRFLNRCTSICKVTYIYDISRP
jgi:hypothetical protein